MQEIENIVRELDIIFKQISGDYSHFQQAVGLECLTDCGACCKNPEVTCTVLEVIPLAYWLFQNGDAEKTMEKLIQGEGQSCSFYRPASADGEMGKCGVYAHRPVICRIFGAYPHQGKKDTQLSVCRKIKDHSAQNYTLALGDFRQKISAEFKFPDQWQMLIHGLKPNWSREVHRINQAVLYALDIVALHFEYKNKADA